MIFDRWGQKVFDTKDPEERWDGRHYSSGEVVRPGVYIWKVDVYDKYGVLHKYNGHVTLVK